MEAVTETTIEIDGRFLTDKCTVKKTNMTTMHQVVFSEKQKYSNLIKLIALGSFGSNIWRERTS